MRSEKDLKENVITGNFIKGVFVELSRLGMIDFDESSKIESGGTVNAYFVRRLRHLQHICQSFEGRMKKPFSTVGKMIYLMKIPYPLTFTRANL